MKLLVVVFLFACLSGLGQEKKAVIFADAGAQFYSTQSKSYVAPVASFTVSAKTYKDFHIGGSMEIGSFHYTNYYQSGYTGGTSYSGAVLVDFRYFFASEKGILIPILRVGYNFLSSGSSSEENTSYKTKGGTQWAIGLAYSFPVFKNGNGFTVTAQYINRRFKNVISSPTEINTSYFNVGGFAPTIGINF